MNKLTIKEKVFIPVSGSEPLVKEETNKYILSKEEIREFAKSILKEGILMERQLKHLKYDEFINAQEQYINLIL